MSNENRGRKVLNSLNFVLHKNVSISIDQDNDKLKRYPFLKANQLQTFVKVQI